MDPVAMGLLDGDYSMRVQKTALVVVMLITLGKYSVDDILDFISRVDSSERFAYTVAFVVARIVESEVCRVSRK